MIMIIELGLFSGRRGESNSDDNIIELGLFSGRRGWGRATVMIMIT